jgi:UDP-N-acetyl-D-galactosamine dehydrogenase
VDVIKALQDYGIQVVIFDPWANPVEVQHEYSIVMMNEIPKSTFDAVVLGVAHSEFIEMDIASLRKECSVLYDVKGVLTEDVDGKL